MSFALGALPAASAQAASHECIKQAHSRWTPASRTDNHGYVDATHTGGNDGDPLAVPGAYREAEIEPAVALFTLDVDGEVFALSASKDGGTHYAWLSGPNEDYGFSTSAPPNVPLEEHREHIRVFLAQIDPATGYVEDD